MDRARRRAWLLAIATVVPAVALGLLALRSIKSEQAIRGAESDAQVREFLKVAGREIQGDLDGRLTLLRAASAGEPARPVAPEEPPDLAELIRRERPDLLPPYLQANAFEFAAGDPERAA